MDAPLIDGEDSNLYDVMGSDESPNPDADLNSVTHDGTHKEDWLDLGFKAQDVVALEKTANLEVFLNMF